MLDAFYISAIGLQAQKQQLDALAVNFANLGTTAFKRQSVDFSTILDRAPPRSAADVVPAADARTSRVSRNLAQGEIRATQRPLDIAIVGAGFLEIALPGERTGYSRVGSLQVNADGVLSLNTGYPLKADVRVPNGATDVEIRPDGSVAALLSGDSEPTVLGQIELALFQNPEALDYRGEGVFLAADGIEPMRLRPGEESAPELAVSSLEGSNVRMTDEMAALVLMQRIYELNSRVAQVADEMIGISNNLRRT